MRTRPVLSVLLSLALAGCGPPRDTLRVAERVPLPADGYATVAIDPSGMFWLGGPGSLLRLEPGAAPPEEFAIDLADPVEFVGADAGRVYFRAPAALALFPGPGTGISTTASGPIDAAALDPVGEYLLATSDAGTVVAYQTSDLAPVWGWAAVGAPSRAVAFAPEGDRVYQAVAAGDFIGPPQILVRDLQTGRIVRRVGTPEEVRVLVAGEDGVIYGAMWEEGRNGSIFALAWREGDLDFRWTTPLEELRLSTPVRLERSPTGTVLAVLATDEDTGLHLLDVETGRSIDRLGGAGLDLAFDPAGRLWLLYPDELRRME